MMHEALKTALGIETANCSTCCHLGSDGDGYEYNGTWPVCNYKDSYGNLKSFPFKKDMKCWHPEFWASKFVEIIKTGSDEELQAAYKAFGEAMESCETAKEVACTTQNEDVTR